MEHHGLNHEGGYRSTNADSIRKLIIRSFLPSKFLLENKKTAQSKKIKERRNAFAMRIKWH